METKSAEEFVNNLLTKDAADQPSDKGKPEDLVMRYPEWYDEEQFNRGRKFYNEFCFSFTGSMLLGLVAVFAVPSILNVLIHSRRSSSVYTAYKRYLSTLLHTVSWFEHELKPGSVSWRSLETVRSRHIRASLASKSKGVGIVSQRDIALTQFGFIGFSILKPDKFGIRQNAEGDWEAYNHFWRTIGYMIGLEDRYNICRKTVEETRYVCQLLLDRVFTPCMENIPEHFEHMARVMLDGMVLINPTVDADAMVWVVKNLADVPGYIYTENERIQLQRRLRKALDGKALDTGIPVTDIIEKSSVEGLPDLPPRKLYYKDYYTIESPPQYKELNFKSKLKLYLNNLYIMLYTCALGRWFFNLNFKFSLFLMRYCPYMAFLKFGVKASLVNIFEEDPKDDTRPQTNAEYYRTRKHKPWYKLIWELLW